MLLTLALPAALLLVAPTALGAGQLTVTDMQPAQSTNLQPGTAVTFRVTSACVNQAMFVEVSTSSTLDADGTLADVGQQDRVSMEAQPDGTYTATVRGSAWLSTPGTYYWQGSIAGVCEGLEKQTWVTPVVGIVVLKPASGGGEDVTAEVQDNGEILTIEQARASIRDGVLKMTRRLPRGLKRTCTRRGSGSILAVICTASWIDSKKYRYNGSWRMALNDDGTIEARFDGRRATAKCLKTAKQKKRCYKRYRRSVTIS
jgi:hypothetical protein